MTPRIETKNPKKLVGIKLSLSLANYKIGDLWKNFMPRRKEISNTISQDLISMSVYSATYFSNFSPNNQFEKWAAVEVINFENLPPEMETYLLPEGLYAIFNYKGLNTDRSVFQYIFQTWLPQSGYTLDNRPQLEILGSRYKNNDPNSEEEIWIPIK